MTPATWCAIGVGALVVFVGVPLAIGTWFLRAANDHDFDLLDVPMGDELDGRDDVALLVDGEGEPMALLTVDRDLTEAERQQIIDAWNATVPEPRQVLDPRLPILERTVLAQAEFDAHDIPFVREVDPSDVVLNDRIARARLADHEQVLDRALGPENQQPKGDR